MSSNACRHASGTWGCEKARAATVKLLGGFVFVVCDSGTAALSSAANLSGNQYCAALTIASCVGTYPSGQKSLTAWPFRRAWQSSEHALPRVCANEGRIA